MRLAAVLLLYACCDQVFAQAVANATIHGVVSDASGAVVAGATIKATQTDKGQVRTAVSGADGSYTVPDLPIGPYRLEITAPSFNTVVRSGIVLQVGNNVLIDIALQVGPTTQEVRVAANATMVETQDTS